MVYKAMKIEGRKKRIRKYSKPLNKQRKKRATYSSVKQAGISNNKWENNIVEYNPWFDINGKYKLRTRKKTIVLVIFSRRFASVFYMEETGTGHTVSTTDI